MRFLPQDAAKRVVEEFKEELTGLLLSSGKGKGYHIVILNSEIGYKEGQMELLDENVLFEFSYNKENWGDSDYKKIARAKAFICLREQRNSGKIPALLLRTDDVKWEGGVCYQKRLIVALSGYKQKEDKAYALKVAQRCDEVAEANYEAWEASNPNSSFID